MDYSKYQIFAKLMSAALVLMYALVPYILNALNIYFIPWAADNLLYSMCLFVVVLFLPHYKFRYHLFRFDLKRNHWIKTYILFFVCALVFSLWPWHDDRVSVGASVSALFRALWILNVFCFVNASEREKLGIIFLTAALVFIDQSRTYFMVAFMVVALSSRRKLSYMGVGMLGVVLVAAVRMGESSSAFVMLTYGIVGEGYNGAKPVGQVLEIDSSQLNYLQHIALTFAQPFYLPFEMFLERLLGFELPSQDQVLMDAVKDQLGEQLSPMGGWYILADFIWYGPVGIVLLFLYVNLTWFISNWVLNTRYSPIGALFFFLSIKATPYVYYKMLLYMVLIALALGLVGFYKDKRLRNIGPLGGGL